MNGCNHTSMFVLNANFDIYISSFDDMVMRKVIIVSIMAVITSIALISILNNSGAPNPDLNVTSEKEAPKPTQINTSGISNLVAFELPSTYIDPQYYYLIKEGEYNFIDRVIKNGITLITDDELKTYYDKFSDPSKAYTFGISTSTGIKYYVIHYFETPLSLENHNITVTIPDVDEQLVEQFKQLPVEVKEYIKEAIADPYQWHVVDEDKARAIVSLLRKDGISFRTTIDNYIGKGEEGIIRILYLGPYSEELQMPEFKEIYGDIGKSLGG